MYKNDDSVMHMMIDIMEIRQEPEFIEKLEEWVRNDGIDNVFEKVIHMYSLDL